MKRELQTGEYPANASGADMRSDTARRRSTPEAPTPLRIMLVDDEQPVRAVIKAMLELTGHTVIAFEAAPLAFDTLQAYPTQIDVVIVDQTMPDMTGLQFVTRLREAGHRHAVVLITGDTSPFSPHVLKALDAAVLGKPFPMDHLIDRVQTAHERSCSA